MQISDGLTNYIHCGQLITHQRNTFGEGTFCEKRKKVVVPCKWHKNIDLFVVRNAYVVVFVKDYTCSVHLTDRLTKRKKIRDSISTLLYISCGTRSFHNHPYNQLIRQRYVTPIFEFLYSPKAFGKPLNAHIYIYVISVIYSHTYRYLFYTANNITIIILIIFLLLLCFMCYVMCTCIIEPFTNYTKCWIRF